MLLGSKVFRGFHFRIEQASVYLLRGLLLSRRLIARRVRANGNDDKDCNNGVR